MMRNLVANAVRYTSHGGIVIGARRRGARVSVVVVDTGVGIAPEHSGRIFEEFYQVRSGDRAATASSGMGLGLAIVRRLGELLGHEVAVVSRLGAGRAFASMRRGRPMPCMRSPERCRASRASGARRSTERSWRSWTTIPQPSTR